MPNSNVNRPAINGSPARERRLWFVAALLLLCGSAVQAAGDAANENDSMARIPARHAILQTLKPSHPRLLIGEGGFEALAELIKNDAVAKRWYGQIRRRAEKIIDEPVCTYDIPDGKRLLGMSRRVVDRMYHLALVYRITGDGKYLDRAWAELSAAAKFPDWNPRHFLDTAEMTHALAIGYDWLYEDLSPPRRKVIREAIVRHGLTPALKVYHNDVWWAKSPNNWNQVCNGGIASGALAIAGEAPELSAEIVRHAVKSLPRAMRNFSPDGGWYEGPSYWAYATRYNVMVVAALDTALGTDFGLSEIEGFSDCGDFPIHLHGPTGYSFNFADAHPGRLNAHQLQWLARRFDRPDYAAVRFKRDRPHPLDLVWYDGRGKEADLDVRPLDKLFSAVQVATMRSAWGDPDAAFVGVKAGRNGVSHDNLDLGSFIYEVNGVRWAVDLGAGNYNLPNYFGKLRYTYYRLRAEGHNTIVLNPSKQPDQLKTGKATFTRFVSKPDYAAATVDLAGAYGKQVESAKRSFRLDDGRRTLTVTDKLALPKPSEFWWFMHTQAKVAIADDGRSATLTHEGKSITVTIDRGPAAAKLTLRGAQPLPTSPDPEGQNPNNGAKMVNAASGGRHSRVGETPQWGQPDPRKAFRKIAIHLTDVSNVNLAVKLKPNE